MGSSDTYHEPLGELSQQTRDLHRGIVSLIEELEAIDWYQQRADAVFNGFGQDAISGIIEASPHGAVRLPASATEYPQAILQALEVLREAGVNGPYALALGSDSFKELSLATDNGYPVRKRIEQQILDGPVLWAPAVPGAVILSVRGGDFVLTLGQDLSIGYADHDRENVDLYLVESLAFRVLEGSAAVHVRPST